MNKLEQAKEKGTVKGLKVIPLSLIAFISIALLLKLLYSLPLKDSLLWYAGIFICFYAPGNLLLRWLDLNKDEYFINLFHSVALGTALIPLAYTILRRISHPELTYPFMAVIFLIWLFYVIRDFKKTRINVYTSYKDVLSALVLISIVFLLLHLSYFTDIVYLEKGFKIRTTPLTETIFHLGIINVIKEIFPPFYPYVSGIDFSYHHLNMHLEIEMFHRLFSVDIMRLTFFYFPFLYFCLLVYLPFIFIYKFWKLRFLGVIIGILIFGSDLSFIPGLLGILPPDKPWTTIFQTTIWPIFTLNSNLPALSVLFLCILYLKQFYENSRLKYLIIFALLGYSAYGFKSSMGPHIMGASFLTGLALVFMKERRKGALICAISALTSLVMVIDAAFFRESASNSVLSINLFNNFLSSIRGLNISNMPWVFYFLLFPIYIIASFGVRALGFYAVKDLFRERKIDPILVFLLIFTVSGFLLSETLFLSASLFGAINNAAWFSRQSLIGAWLLFFYFFLKIRHSKKYLFGFLTIVVLLSAPSTIQFLALRFTQTYSTVSSNAMEVVRYFENTPPGSIILHPLNDPEPSLASNLAGRLSIINDFRSFVPQHITEEEQFNRENDVILFFNQDAEINQYLDRSIILKKYMADYVYAPSAYAEILEKEPMLLQVLKNSEYVVYRVKR